MAGTAIFHKGGVRDCNFQNPSENPVLWVSLAVRLERIIGMFESCLVGNQSDSRNGSQMVLRNRQSVSFFLFHSEYFVFTVIRC